MVSGDTRYRVYNRCRYDVGVMTLNGIGLNIKAGSFQMLTVNDILYIESICAADKYFTEKKLVAVDDSNCDVPFSDIGLYPDPENEKHSDDEIVSMLKQSVKKIEAWINGIDDETELHDIYMVATSMDLPMSKLKVLKAKMPNKDWLDELD